MAARAAAISLLSGSVVGSHVAYPGAALTRIASSGASAARRHPPINDGTIASPLPFSFAGSRHDRASRYLRPPALVPPDQVGVTEEGTGRNNQRNTPGRAEIRQATATRRARSPNHVRRSAAPTSLAPRHAAAAESNRLLTTALRSIRDQAGRRREERPD